MKKIQVETVVFDYGNTLVFDPFENIVKNKLEDFKNILKKFGYKFSNKRVFEVWYNANKNINYPHITHFAQEKPIIIDALKKLNIKPSDMLSIASRFLTTYRKELEHVYRNDKRNKELKDTLNYLKNKGKTMAVLSDGRQFDVNNAVKWCGISKYFDLIVSSEKVGVEKPDKKAFEYVLNGLRKLPENTVYIGDNPMRDVEGAKKLGMKTILFIPPRKFRKQMPWRKYKVKISVEPDMIIKKFSDLKKVII